MPSKLLLILLNLVVATISFAKDVRAYISIESVSQDTGLEVKFKHDKTARNMEAGQGFEIPAKAVQGDAFPLVVQMVKEGLLINACEISVEQLRDFNRTYHCTARTGEAHVSIRVYTNLHGNVAKARQTIARK